MEINIDNKIKLNLYKEMLRIRNIEFAISERYSEQEMRCPVHLSIGQEAVPVGISANLSKKDLALSAHRSHAHYLGKGGDLKSMLSELYGKETGCAMGKGGSMHLYDKEAGLIAAVPIVGSTIPIGVGVAWAKKLKDENDVVVIYFGDGATEEGVFSESLDFASLKDLPVLFVCENNFYSVYTPLGERQHESRKITEISKAHGVESVNGDGNDVFSVYDISKLAINKIKNSGRPILIEFSTFRWLEHCGPNWDDDLGYRKKNELSDWMEKCPIKRLESTLRSENLLNDKILNEINSEIKLEIEEAFQFSKESKLPSESELFTHIYS